MAAIPRELSVCRLDVDRFPIEQRLSLRPGGSPRVEFYDGLDHWTLDGCPVAWFRRLGQPSVDPRLSDAHRKWALGEVEQTLTGAFDLILPRHWINPYWAARRAAIKVFQYQQIADLGIEFAGTLISNDPAAVRRWAGAVSAPVVYKSLHSPMLDPGDEIADRQFVYTTSITAADLADDDAIVLAPCQFQLRVAAEHELRITSIGQRHTAVQIDHQPWVDGEPHDWRAHHARLSYGEVTCPSEIERQLNLLMATLDLEYGASDWIVDDEGRYVLLEVNPHGSWLWLEEAIPGLGITQSIADYIVERAADATAPHR